VAVVTQSANPKKTWTQGLSDVASVAGWTAGLGAAAAALVPGVPEVALVGAALGAIGGLFVMKKLDR
jgi:hypothetical protein